MQAREIELPGIGEPETLRLRTRELGEPGPGQAVVRVEASGVSFAEQQMRRGKYYDQPKFPFVPGYDLVGIDEATGQRVAALTKVGALGGSRRPRPRGPRAGARRSRPRGGRDA